MSNRATTNAGMRRRSGRASPSMVTSQSCRAVLGASRHFRLARRNSTGAGGPTLLVHTPTGASLPQRVGTSAALGGCMHPGKPHSSKFPPAQGAERSGRRRHLGGREAAWTEVPTRRHSRLRVPDSAAGILARSPELVRSSDHDPLSRLSLRGTGSPVNLVITSHVLFAVPGAGVRRGQYRL